MPEYPKRPCAATSASGEACRSWAMRGGTLCATHLGRAHGREATLDEQTIANIAKLVSAGTFMNVALAAAGVPRRTFYEWWRRGGSDALADAPFRAMRARIEQARAEGEARNVAQIARAAAEDWRAAAWLLERSAPERWGRPEARRREPDEDATATPSTPDPFAEVDELADKRRARRRT
jgi:hypothetical protein